MSVRDPIPKNFADLGSSFYEELSFDELEIQRVAEQGIACFQEAVQDNDNVMTDIVTYRHIPHSDGLRTAAIRLSLRDRRFSSFDIQLPRKAESTAITITATDAANPMRKFIFSEVDEHDDQAGGFVIDDTDWLNAEKAGRPIESFMESHEIAQWLYKQAGVSDKDTGRKLKTESDPVQDAANMAGVYAEEVWTQRQVKVPINECLYFFGEEIAVQTPNQITLQVPSRTDDLPVARPVRMYNVWVNSILDTESYGTVIETLTASFSPDNPALLVPNPRSSLSLSVDTTKSLTSEETRNLLQERRQAYQGNSATLFENVHKSLLQRRSS